MIQPMRQGAGPTPSVPLESAMKPERLVIVPTLTLALLASTAATAQAADVGDDLEPSVPEAYVSGSALQAETQASPQAGRLAGTKLSTGAFTQAMSSTLSRTASTSAVLRSSLSGVVVNADTGAVTWAHNAGTRRLPASTQKVITAHTVLRSMNLSTKFTTTALQSRANPGNLYLRGGGDPSLTYTRLLGMAAQTATQLKAQKRTRVVLYLDSTFFPSTGSSLGWSATTARRDTQLVRGLTLAGYRGSDGTTTAGRAFATYLKRYGINATLRGKAKAPSARTLGTTQSATVRTLMSTMLSSSNNDYAEYLFRHAARTRGYSATWAGARANQRALLAADGIPIGSYAGYDGSGLSRSNRMPMTTLSGVIRALWRRSSDRNVVFAWGAMPRSGQTGTLYSRFRKEPMACARGQVLAKTGTLRDVVSLAGVAKGSDGTNRVFVFLGNGTRQITATRNAMDYLATTVVGCRLG